MISFSIPNVLAVATGIEEHNNYAVDFIKATGWIKEEFARCTRQWWREQSVVLFPWK